MDVVEVVMEYAAQTYGDAAAQLVCADAEPLQ